MIKKIVSSDRKIRVAIVGCGRISKKHFESIDARSDELDLVSICDSDANILDLYRKKYGVPAYLHLNEMIENEELDLVVLCTPSGLHARQAEVAAKHGVGVITEKPMATSWRDGLRMVKACDDAGVRLFVVKQNRRNKTVQLLKKRLKKAVLVEFTWSI